MRKSVIILVLLAFSVQNPQRVEAGAFATEVTQLLNHAQLVLQYIRQGAQLAAAHAEEVGRHLLQQPEHGISPIRP